MQYLSDNELPNFEKMPEGLIPAVVQDAHTSAVLMLGYMNALALEATRKSGLVTFYSRSKKRLWVKGETSGNTLSVQDILQDCDRDALLVKAIPAGPVCHNGDDTCWGEANHQPGFLKTLEQVIHQRKNVALEDSYTARLFKAGIPKIAQKVGEEAVETVIEALGDDAEQLRNETADLLFHILVLLAAKGIRLDEVEAILAKRSASSMPGLPKKNDATGAL
jgi:phosphoribosyl-AMP cyclohydrolase / phosphoribosyl-ATP pyrophosphohydrolase